MKYINSVLFALGVVILTSSSASAGIIETLNKLEARGTSSESGISTGYVPPRTSRYVEPVYEEQTFPEYIKSLSSTSDESGV